MNNQELEQKILELLKETNYFDFLIAVKNFEKEYKESDFFKATKEPLSKVIREAKIFYLFSGKNLIDKIQDFINNLNLDKINEILEQVAGTFNNENQEILEAVKELQNLQ